MANIRKHLFSLRTYNCQSFTPAKVPFVKELLDDGDIVLLQEHCKFQEQLDVFHELGDVSYHGTSSMDSHAVLLGRPFGGTAIIWNNNCKERITPIESHSGRISAVTVTFSNGVVLLIINVYLPCDDRRKQEKYMLLLETLGDIQSIMTSVTWNCVIVAGDLNCDFSRHTPHVLAIKDFIQGFDLKKCLDHVLADVPFTFESKGSGCRSTIDHVLASDDLFGHLISYHTLDSPDNLSDHCGLTASFDMSVLYFERSEKVFTPRSSWKKAGICDILKYQAELDLILDSIPLPQDALLCRDPLCTQHIQEINSLNSKIVDACLLACDKTIPKTQKFRKNKFVPGWNEFVKQRKADAMMWHRIWKDNGCPLHGDIAEARRTTRHLYHYAIRQCRRDEIKIRSTRMAERLSEGRNLDFWKEVSKFKNTRTTVASTVDGVNNPREIAQLFSDKFKVLYQSVPYDRMDMEKLFHDVTERVTSDFNCLQQSDPTLVSRKDICDLVAKLKLDKADGNSGLTTDCLIHGTPRLFDLLAHLFSCFLTHGVVPSEFLLGTMSPIPKSSANSNCSDKYRAITLSSVIGRLLELLILNKEGCSSLVTSNLQLGFKKHCSTTLCTGLLKEIATHFLHNGSNVYALFLDASKAFDRVDYLLLFKRLLSKNMNSVYLRSLMNLYLNHKLRVRWNTFLSNSFEAANGVKQGGILSPTLFSTYTDGLVDELRNSGEGCYVGPHFCGVLAYADDVCLLSPTINGLKSMVKVCENYSQDYKVMFNGAKSQLLVFGSLKGNAPVQIDIGGCTITSCSSASHLGHKAFPDPRIGDMDSVIKSFQRQFNLFLSRFACVPPNVRIKLFNSYCTSFYGIQLCKLANLKKLHVTYRKSVRRLLGVPYRTHCALLPCVTGTLCPEHMFSKRFIKFGAGCLSHKFPVVGFIFKNSLNNPTSVFCQNWLFCLDSLGVDIKTVVSENLSSLNKQTMLECSKRCSSVQLRATSFEIKQLYLSAGV